MRSSTRILTVVQETVTLEGHLIDSDILRRAFARIVEGGGEFEVLECRVGATNADPSFAKLAVKARDPHALDAILEGLAYLGASASVVDARTLPAEADGILPDEFYSTTNFETFVRIGLHPDWGGTYFLPRLVGLARALELCWTGASIDAAEALRIGLVNRVVPHGELVAAATALATGLAAAPRTSVRLAKGSLGAALERTLEQCLDAEMEAQAACWASADAAEGLKAFVEKRTPRFGSATATAEADLSPTGRRFE